jgi:hypothetical protein
MFIMIFRLLIKKGCNPGLCTGCFPYGSLSIMAGTVSIVMLIWTLPGAGMRWKP